MQKFLFGKLFQLLILLTIFTSCVQQSPESNQKQIIKTDKAPSAVGIYSQAIKVGNMLYLSGQIGLIPETRELAGDNLNSQAHQTLSNIKAVLEAADFTLSEVVSAQVFLADMDDYEEFNTIYKEYFPDNPPARAVVEVSRIPLDARVEIMIIAGK